MARRLALPDGTYTSSKTGEKVTVKDGMVVEPEVMSAPDGNPRATELANSPVGTATAIGNAASMGLLARGVQGAQNLLDRPDSEKQAAKELFRKSAANHPVAAGVAGLMPDVGSMFLPGGPIAGAAVRTLGSANYADTIGESPVIAGALGAAGEGGGVFLKSLGGKANKLATVLRELFGEKAAPATKALDAGATLPKAAGTSVQATTVPVGEWLSSEQAKEDKDFKELAKRRATSPQPSK